MRRLAVSIIAAVVVLAFAGALFLRMNGEDDRIANGPLVIDEKNAYPAVLYRVQPTSGDPTVWSYHVPDGTVQGPLEDAERIASMRLNQSSDLCDKDHANVPFTIECNMNFVANVLVLTVYGMMGEEKWMQAYTVDLKDLAIFPSTSEGYLTPVAVADDKSAIYLGRRVETESYVAGLWKLDVATGDVSEIAYVRENKLYQYDINPATKRLVGVTFVPPESLDDPLTGPSSIHLVDLATDDGESVMGGAVKGGAFENPMLSDDGLSYAFYASGVLFGEASTVIYGPGETPEGGGTEIDGIMKDWFGDTVVFDRDGNLFLYDLKTDIETRLTNETDATVEYVGVVR